MVNTEGEDILGPGGYPVTQDDLENYAFAGVKQNFEGIVTPNNTNASKNNINVVYKIFDNNNTLLDTLNYNTDSNGKHTLQYTFPHKGNYTIIASVGDDTFSLPVSVESLVDEVTISSSSNNVPAGSNITLNACVTSSTNHSVEGADVTFKITENIDSFTEETSISDWYELDYDIHLPKINLECKLKGQLAVSIIPKNSSTESQILQISSNSYQTLRIVDDGNSLKYYLDNILQGTLSTGIKKLYIWGAGGSVKELTFTSNDTVSASATGSSGETSISYNYPGGTCNVKAIANYGIDTNESNSITLTELQYDGILLTSDNSIVSSGDTVQLTAQLTLNGDNASVSGETVQFINNETDEVIGTGTTNASGIASVSYLVKDTNPLNIKAKTNNMESNTTILNNILFKPPLDGTDAITTWTNMTNTTGNGIFSSHGSFLTEGWSNTGLWQLDFDVQTNNWTYIGLMPLCDARINPYTDAKRAQYAATTWEGISAPYGFGATWIKTTSMSKINDSNWHHITMKKISSNQVQIFIDGGYEHIWESDTFANISELHFGTRDNQYSRNSGGIINFKNIVVYKLD